MLSKAYPYVLHALLYNICRYRCTESSEKGNDHRTFEKLCEHLENLLNVNKQCQLTVKHTLLSLKEKSYFNVYSDILKRLNQIAEY